MSLRAWEKKVLESPGAATRVAVIEDKLRLTAGLTALRERAGYSQRELARRMGISQPRVAAMEQSRNVTIDVLEQYVDAVGGKLEVTVVRGKRRIPLIVPQVGRGTSASSRASKAKAKAKAPSADAGKARRAAAS